MIRTRGATKTNAGGNDMKVQQEATKNEEAKFKPENLTDLPVTEEQAGETKGGTVVTDYAILECRFRDSTAK